MFFLNERQQRHQRHQRHRRNVCVCLRAPFPRRHAITRSPSRAFSSFRLLCADQCAVSARAIVLSLSLSLLSRPLLLFKNFSLLTSPTSSFPPCSAHMCSTSSYVLGPPSLPWAIALALHRGTLDLRRVYAMSARTTARGAGARSAGERASARISAGGADARSVGGRHLPAPAREEQMQGVRGSRHLPAPAREKLMQEPWELRGGAGRVNRARAVRRVYLGW
jgi:hypothetical protein